ncbi:MAG: 16S rRNA (cytosine(1402)-N(4))-methyltransferase RsmH, partial [Pseudomonadota bacterium]
LGIEQVDAVGLDLGTSSPQLDDPERGFSFRFDGPLDMRMGDSGETAADWVNSASQAELSDVIREFGEERHHRRVAKSIIEARKESPIETTERLAKIVRPAVGRSADGLDPATRTFQAIRIKINDETGEIARGLAAAERILRPGGRLAVISFHSLEDRLVKQFLHRRSTASSPSRHAPVPTGEQANLTFTLPRRRSLTPSADETRRNPRARSARLRAAVRTDAPAQPETRGTAA